MAGSHLTPERLRELLDYDPATGVFINRTKRSRLACAGAIAGTITTRLYRAITIDGRIYAAHRLAWLYVHGRWPLDQIDHIDCNKMNNAIANLREASHRLNQQNIKTANKNNKLGILGVIRLRNGFRSCIYCNGKATVLGIFATPEEAHAVYLKAKRRLHQGCTI